VAKDLQSSGIISEAEGMMTGNWILWTICDKLLHASYD